MSQSEIQVIRRRISPEQQARRRHIVAQTIRLLAVDGHAVSMEAVAAASEVSRSTLYRYYTSREHLLAEVTLEAGYNLIRYFEAHPPEGATLGERIESLSRQLVATAAENQVLLACCVSNLLSEDPAVLDAYTEIEDLVSGILGSVLGEANRGRLAPIQGVVFRYLLGAFMLATSGKADFQQVGEEFAGLCRTLLADIWSQGLNKRSAQNGD